MGDSESNLRISDTSHYRLVHLYTINVYNARDLKESSLRKHNHSLLNRHNVSSLGMIGFRMIIFK